MSSGTYATKAGFREDKKPGDTAPCPAARYEDRGPAILLTGLCHLCGRATTMADADGRPRHDQIPGLVA